ncbi:hypothetical protein JVT61DRAFT_816 [Boletus reticuloceps]|uniref:Uncharacterized protein n=1 Tax=Boletus reticuloceps TaxID=495285 RepID=A0A8I2Z3C9_9AGAM|nr:hypothetical protein JVT61DRAFT_816 [Boletus reticuloceps]
MARPTTRAKNASQHPGQVVLNTMQKRCTAEQKQADNAQVEQTQKEQAAARDDAIQQIAQILDQDGNAEWSILTNPPRPRPRPRCVKPSQSFSSQSEEPAEDVERDEDKETEDEKNGDKGTDNDETVENIGEEKNVDRLTHKAAKQKRSQKTLTRDAVQAAQRVQDVEGPDHQCVSDKTEAEGQQPKKGNSTVLVAIVQTNSPMLLLTETILFYWDSIDHHLCQDSQATKDEFAGIMDWADKITSPKSLQSIFLSHRSTSSCYARSGSTTGTGKKAPRATPATTNYTTTPAPSTISEEAVVDYVDGDDTAERNLLSSAPPVHNQATQKTARMGVMEVVSSSELDERNLSPPVQPTSLVHKKKENASSCAPRSKRKMKQSEENEPDVDDQSTVVPSKRARKSGTSQCSGSGINNKYINEDLPEGATTNNMWRCLFISALAHFIGGYDSPWTINSDKYLSVLQVIWDTVYKGKIEHAVVVNGPVHSLAKQGLNNWRGGLAAAAVAGIAALFAEHAIFLDPKMRVDFVTDMMKKNRFLFAVNKGTDKKKWTGLWRSPLVLQTFAAHFNYIQGQAEVQALEKEHCGPRAALALACAAVFRVLTLIAEGNISFTQTETKQGIVWSALVAKGPKFEFNESAWGDVTSDYLKLIAELSEENFSLIITEAQKYVKKGIPATSAMDTQEEDSDDDDLFAFR